MKFLRTALFALVAGLSTLPLAPTAAATSMLYVDAFQQADMATAIVEGVVGSKDTLQFTDGRVYTDTQLNITRVIAGAAPGVINLRQKGGLLADRRVVIPGDAELDTGDRVVAIVRKVDGKWYLTAMALSVWHIEGDGPGAAVRRELAGLALHEDTSQGTKGTQTTPLEFTTLAALYQALNGIQVGEPADDTP